jgi:hypothetical protein
MAADRSGAGNSAFCGMDDFTNWQGTPTELAVNLTGRVLGVQIAEPTSSGFSAAALPP